PPISPLFPYTTLFRSPRTPLRITPAPMPLGQLPANTPHWLRQFLEILAQALDAAGVPKPNTPDNKQATQPARDERNATDDGPGEDRKSTRLNSSHVKI